MVFAYNIVILTITQARAQRLYSHLPAFVPTGVPTLPQIRLGQVQCECYQLLDKPSQRKSTLERLTRGRAPARLAPVRTGCAWN